MLNVKADIHRLISTNGVLIINLTEGSMLTLKKKEKKLKALNVRSALFVLSLQYFFLQVCS